MGLKVQTDVAPVGSSWSNQLPASQSVIATGDYKAADPTPVEITPPLGAANLELVFNVSAQSGAGNTITVNVEVWDPASAAFVAVGTAPTDATGGAHVFRVIVSPYLTAAATILQHVLGQVIRVRPVGSGTRTTLNYTVSAHWSS